MLGRSKYYFFIALITSKNNKTMPSETRPVIMPPAIAKTRDKPETLCMKSKLLEKKPKAIAPTMENNITIKA